MIEIASLAKSYGSHEVLREVNLRVMPGEVVGFLGPNGAGKSTTLRILVGLVEASAGTATILGMPFRTLPSPARHVGVLLDASAFHGGRTGQETLRLTARHLGVPGTRVAECLSLVGLDTAAASKRVKTYSLGMRQRLGLAHALLGDPQVLILDEPGNGLDPGGIRWLRTFLRGYADAGGTVLLSSHLLSEVEKVADRVVIIDQGRVTVDGLPGELTRSDGCRVVADAEDALRQALTRAAITHRPHPSGGLAADGTARQVGQVCQVAGIALVTLVAEQTRSLEDLVLSGGALSHGSRKES